MIKEKKHFKQTAQGVIRIDGRGNGRLEITETGETIEIENRYLNTALNGDTVVVLRHAAKKGLIAGEVDKILIRAKTRFVGIIEKAKGVYFVATDDRKMYADILIPAKETRKAQNGQKVLAEIIDWTDPKKDPIGRVLKVIGTPGEHQVEMETIILEKGFEREFPLKVEAEANKIKTNFQADIEAEIPKRRDFRQTSTLTIDPIDAKDFDDAISFRDLENGYFEVGVHIADVTHYLRAGSALDAEAIKRATSIYLVDQTIPMLPEVLSNDVCSLIEGQDRLTFSAVFTINLSGEIKEEWFGRTIINSDRRFTYEEVQTLLDQPESSQEPYKKELTILNKIAYALRDKKIEQGALSFEDEELRFILDENKKPIQIIKKVRTDSHKLVEDFMLLANKKVAEFVSKINHNQEHTFVYRIHEAPDRDKLINLADFLKPLGYNLEVKGEKIDQDDLNRLLAKTIGTPEEFMIQKATIRSMSKAIYSMKNIGHYGLAFPHYTHFTSPIRRYPDDMVHRLLAIYLKGSKPKKEMLEEYAALSIHSSEREKQAQEAERDSVKFKQVEFMQTKIGQTLKGVISGVTEWGIFVEDIETKSEGMIRLRDLDDDYYSLDEKNYCLVGKKTKKKYRLGDTVNFVVTKTDLKNKNIDFKLI